MDQLSQITEDMKKYVRPPVLQLRSLKKLLLKDEVTFDKPLFEEFLDFTHLLLKKITQKGFYSTYAYKKTKYESLVLFMQHIENLPDVIEKKNNSIADCQGQIAKLQTELKNIKSELQARLDLDRVLQEHHKNIELAANVKEFKSNLEEERKHLQKSLVELAQRNKGLLQMIKDRELEFAVSEGQVKAQSKRIELLEQEKNMLWERLDQRERDLQTFVGRGTLQSEERSLQKTPQGSQVYFAAQQIPNLSQGEAQENVGVIEEEQESQGEVEQQGEGDQIQENQKMARKFNIKQLALFLILGLGAAYVGLQLIYV